MTNGTNKILKAIYSKFSKSTKPIHKAYIESIHALVNLTEIRDPYTKRHALKVSNHAVALTKCIGLPKETIAIIKLAAILHDIGKVGIREKILLKPSSLTGKEYEEVKRHPEIGVEVIKPLKFFNEVMSIIRYHHENFDGTGYPDGLKGKKIPIGSRILAIADVYDALTSRRAYRKAYSHKEAINIMRKDMGKKFDPELLSVFLDYISSKTKIK